MKRMMMSAGRRGAFTLNVTSSVASPKFRQMALNAGWNGNAALVINITAPLVNTVHFLAGESYPQGVTLKISSGTRVGGTGDAIVTAVPLAIDNLGIISGGGGYGGQGAGITGVWAGVTQSAYGGSGSRGTGFLDTASLVIVDAGTGAAGGYVEWTNEVIGQNRPWMRGAPGGAGGGWGGWGAAGLSSGSSGNGATITGTASPATAGNSPNAAVRGNSLVTWLNTGTRLGTLI